MPLTAARDSGATDRARAGGRIPELDGVRALAIVAVLGLHFNLPWLQGGYLGVDVFFVLSGFLITSLMEAEYQKSGRIDLKAFFIRRLLRLFPALVVLLLVVAIAVGLGSPIVAPGQLLKVEASVALYASNWVQAFTNVSDFGSLQHTWSLAIEGQFYLIWPVVFSRCRRRLSLRSIRRWLVAVSALSAVDMSLTWHGGSTPSVYYRSDCRAGAVLVGAALALCFADPTFREASRSCLLRWSGLVALGGLVVLIYILNVGKHPAIAFRIGFQLAWLLTGLVVAMMVWCPPVPISRVFGCRPAKFVAALSYSLYLWHPVILIALAPHLHLRYSIRTPILIAVVFAVSAASYYLVERPCLRLNKRSVRFSPVRPPRSVALGSTDEGDQALHRRTAGGTPVAGDS